jgi:hypothetical protein
MYFTVSMPFPQDFPPLTEFNYRQPQISFLKTCIRAPYPIREKFSTVKEVSLSFLFTTGSRISSGIMADGTENREKFYPRMR